MQKTAICFISFNRPEYFAQCIAALLTQRNAPPVDWYLFQDGAVHESGFKVTTPDLIRKCVSIFEAAPLPGYKELVLRPSNFGIARNQWEAFEYLFMTKGYEHIIVVEDDLVVSTDWLRLTHVLLDQFRDNKRIATVQASCTGGWDGALGEKVRYNTAMCIGKPHWWGTAIWKDRWEIIRVTYKEYYDFVKKYVYHVRDHQAIRKWYRDVWRMNEDITSQDRAKDWSCFKNGMTRAFTRVNRARYIGVHGVHANPGNFAAGGYAKMTINDMPEDETLSRFDDIPEMVVNQHLLDIAATKEIFSISCDGLLNDR